MSHFSHVVSCQAKQQLPKHRKKKWLEIFQLYSCISCPYSICNGSSTAVSLPCFRGQKLSSSPTENAHFLTSDNSMRWKVIIEGVTLCIFIGKNVKLSHNTPMEEQGERMYSSCSIDGGEWSESCPGRALPPGKDPRCPLDRRLGGPQSRSGHRR
jgi:hypothetical protein